MRPVPASALVAWTCLAAWAAAGCGVARRNAPEEAPRCFACHGGLSGNAAPPYATVGPADRSNPRVGAHQAHVGAAALRGPIGCEACHPVPPASGAATATHLNGHADVAFGTFAAPGPAPAWDAAARTCSVTCHGAALAGGGGALPIPTWTAVDGAAADCGACHGIPPPSHPAARVDCRACHLDTMLPSGRLDLAGGKHVDGVVEVRAHEAAWAEPASPAFHGLAADRGLGGCAGCHGADLAGGGARVACAACHGDGWRTRCTTCHGGGDDASGAPPRAVLGQEGDPIRVGAHRAHLAGGPLAAPLGCDACHVTPADALDAGHVDEVPAGAVPLATVTFGGLATARGAAPAWDRASATCSATYCHGATLAGGAVPAPTWTTLDGSQAACGACHGAPPPPPHPATGPAGCSPCHPGTVDATGAVIPPAAGGLHLDGTVEAQGHPASWMDTASPGFHAFAADDGLASCQACHGADLSGGDVGVGCASCHGAGFTARCTGCHGGVDDASGAPPRATWGHAGDPVRTGAHRRHLAPGPASPAIGCGACHVTPADAFAPGHVTASQVAAVTFGGLATAGGAAPAWDRASATCSATYCHGATLAGGAVPAPTWTTLDGSQAACGACHGAPPPPPHTAAATAAECHPCHSDTVDAAGALVARSAGGRHLDGAVQLTGHDVATWLDAGGPGFHAYAANDGLAACQACHAADLSGGAAGVGCSACHGAGFTARCTGCHGGTANATGAPPRATWGRGGDPIRTGAHTAHVTAGPLAGAFGCGTCHAVPLDATTPGHVTASPTATVALTGLAAQEVPAAAWTRAGPTCVTYCHGASLLGGTLTTPSWTTLDGTQAACGTCHGLPPATGRHWHVTDPMVGLLCWDCHGAAYGDGTTVNAALHVNGTRDVGQAITSWNGTSCTSICHGRRDW